MELNRQTIEAFRGSKLDIPRDEPRVLMEFESDGWGGQASVMTVFLVGAECPYRCTMCDLWKYTLDSATPVGSLVKQLDRALDKYPRTDWLKLYNASNFFDPRAVPCEDLPSIAERCHGFQRVIVENHPKWIRPSIQHFAESIEGQLEVAMGLESIHDRNRLLMNKEFELVDYERACALFRSWHVDHRAFVLLQPPGTPPEKSVDWAQETASYANRHGARHISIIPTRGGNGVMEKLSQTGLFQVPRAGQLEQALAQSMAWMENCVVSVDLWDWDQLAGHCSKCRDRRRERLEQINRYQIMLESISCPDCIDAQVT